MSREGESKRYRSDRGGGGPGLTGRKDAEGEQQAVGFWPVSRESEGEHCGPDGSGGFDVTNEEMRRTSSRQTDVLLQLREVTCDSEPVNRHHSRTLQL